MRGAFVDQGGLFSYVAQEARVPANHPLRKIRELVRDVLSELRRRGGHQHCLKPSSRHSTTHPQRTKNKNSGDFQLTVRSIPSNSIRPLALKCNANGIKA